MVETPSSRISGMRLAAPAYSLTIYGNDEGEPRAQATNQIPLGVDGQNAEYSFTVANTYRDIPDRADDVDNGTNNEPIPSPELVPEPVIDFTDVEVPLVPEPDTGISDAGVDVLDEAVRLSSGDTNVPQTGAESVLTL